MGVDDAPTGRVLLLQVGVGADGGGDQQVALLQFDQKDETAHNDQTAADDFGDYEAFNKRVWVILHLMKCLSKP